MIDIDDLLVGLVLEDQGMLEKELFSKLHEGAGHFLNQAPLDKHNSAPFCVLYLVAVSSLLWFPLCPALRNILLRPHLAQIPPAKE